MQRWGIGCRTGYRASPSARADESTASHYIEPTSSRIIVISFALGAIAGAAVAACGMSLAGTGRMRSQLKLQRQSVAALQTQVEKLAQDQSQLIRREEVEAAFQEVARLEALRAEQQRLSQRAAMPFPAAAQQPNAVMRMPQPQVADLNMAINEQLAHLNARLGDLGEQFGRY